VEDAKDSVESTNLHPPFFIYFSCLTSLLYNLNIHSQLVRPTKVSDITFIQTSLCDVYQMAEGLFISFKSKKSKKYLFTSFICCLFVLKYKSIKPQSLTDMFSGKPFDLNLLHIDGAGLYLVF